MAQLIHIDGPVDPDRLSEAFDQVVAAHDALRTRIRTVDGAPRAVVLDVDDGQDWRNSTEVIELEQAGVSGWAQDRVGRPLDEARAPIDSVLLRHADGTATWFLDLHHVVTDATSTALIVADTAAAYGGAAIEATSFLDWVERSESLPGIDRAIEHWTRTTLPSVGALYRTAARPTTRSERSMVDISGLGSLLAHRFSQEFRAVSEELAWTNVLVTATAILFHRLTGTNEVAIGVPVHNRSDGASRRVVGPLMEVYPVIVAIDVDDTVASLHRRVSRSVMTTLRHARPGVGQPLGVDAIVNVIPQAGHDDFAGWPTSTTWLHPGAADPGHLLRVQLTNFGGGDPELAVDVNAGAADIDQRRAAPDHFQAVVAAMVQRPDAALDSFSLVGDGERAVHDRWGDGGASAWRGSILARLRAVLQSADRVVLEDTDREGRTTWSGPELWAWVGSISRHLEGRGVGRGDRVAVELGRSADAVAVILATLAIGASYVPIDPEQPVARRSRLVERAQCRLTIDGSSLDEIDAGDGFGPPPIRAIGPSDEAYVLFTSGSSGEPKGVPISHRGLADYLSFALDHYLDQRAEHVGDAEAHHPTIPLFTPLTFDLTVTSLFLPLLVGGTSVVIRPSGAPGLRALVQRADLTWAKATPSHLDVLVHMLPDNHRLRTLVVGGEAFSMRLARQLRRRIPDLAIFNEYGPTEAVVGCMVHEITDEELVGDATDVPIGFPVPGVSLRIVDSGGHIVPLGVDGELLIASAGLTTGYLDRATGERDAVSSAPSNSASAFLELDGRRWYRSGDLVRLDPDGVAVYRGRIDEQMKVGGIRLDPVEVETALEAHPAIRRAAVRLWTPSVAEALFHCVRCGLPSNVPGTSFDDDGVCSSCHDHDRVKVQAASWFRTLDDLRAVRSEARASRTGEHDALVLLSGGKDSTYTLYQMVELGFDVHAVTLDNGFISEGAKENVRRSVAHLGISHEFLTSDAMNDIFRDSLERHSNVCHGCYKTIYTLATVRADQLGIPMIVTGLSRGQLFETRLIPQQFDTDRFDPEAIDRAVIEARKVYHRLDDGPNRLLDTSIFADDSIFDRIRYVDFFRYVDVELDEMLGYLRDHAPWVRPTDTGRSTNCLINSAGIHTHLYEQGYHNYAVPYAWDVRLGHKQRNEAMDELDDQLDAEDVARMLREVDYEPTRRSILAAWFELVDGADEPTPAELRTSLGAALAPHQVPAAFVAVPELPQTDNGKLDTAALPVPDRVHRTQSALHVEPATVVEAMVTGVWERLLGIEPIGVDDDFFTLGGDSLAALELAVLLTDALASGRSHAQSLAPARPVPEDIVFHHRTPKALAAALETLGSDTVTDAGVGPQTAPIARSDGTSPRRSPFEESVLFEHRRRPDHVSYNVGRRWFIEPDDTGQPIDVSSLERAITAMVERHPALRWTHAEPRNCLDAERSIEWKRLDAVRRSEFDELADEWHLRPFDLDSGPLLRVVMGRCLDGAVGVALLVHHIAADDHSFDLMWSDIGTAYEALGAIGNGTDGIDTSGLESIGIDVGDHADWRLTLPTTPDAEFWGRTAERSATAVAGFGSGPTVHEPDGYISRIASITADELRSLPGSTPAASALTALVAVLAAHRRPTDDSVLVGVTASVRDHPSLDPLVGYFLNTLPIVVPVADPDDGVVDGQRLGQLVDEQLAESRRHRSHPYQRILSEAAAADRAQPIIRTLFAFEDLEPSSIGGHDASHRILDSGVAVVDASIFVQRREDRLDLGIEYRGDALSAARAKQVLDDFDAALIALRNDGYTPIDSIGLPSRKGSLLFGAPLESPPSLMPAIRRHLVGATSGAADRPAVRCGDDELSWSDLDQRSGDIASALASNGVRPGTHIGIGLGRSTDLIAAVVGVLRAGCAYVPLDPSYPADRLQRIIDRAEPAAIIDDSWLDGLASDEDAVSHRRWVEPEGSWPAYVIFTSGSTGEPRGVSVTHRQLAASTMARLEHYDDLVDRFLMVSSVGFDSSVAGIFWTLVSGGTIVLPTETEVHDADGLLAIMDRHRITHTLMVPTLYQALLRRGRSQSPWPDVSIVAGESCSADLVEAHHTIRPDAELHNEYGPTETTVWATVAQCQPGVAPVPIGGPIPGAMVAVVHQNGLPVPTGSDGEIVIAGAGVSDGYVGDPVATAERFVDLPGVGRCYRTGDRGRSDGTDLTFLGRVDDQLNLGGVRVEPDEIESVLLGVPGVSAAVVVAADPRPLDDRLRDLAPETVASLMTTAAASADPADALRRSTSQLQSDRVVLIAHLELQEHIREDNADELVVDDAVLDNAVLDNAVLDGVRAMIRDRLPRTLRPQRLAVHRSLPRSSNGKLDRSAAAGLPVPSRTASEPERPEASRSNVGSARQSQAPSHGGAAAPLQIVLSVLRAELDDPSLGPDDDFFESGGDSLAALSVAVRLEEVLGRRFPVTELIDRSTARLIVGDVAPSTFDLLRWLRRDTDQRADHGDRSDPILVLLAPGTGHLMSYQPLIAALEASIDVAGFRLPGEDGVSAPIDRIEPLVDTMLAEWHGFDGRPVVLMGGSSGGLLAWELAVRLADRGTPAAGLIVQDTIHPEEWRRQAPRRRLDQYRDIAGEDGLMGAAAAAAQRLQLRLERRRILRYRANDTRHEPESGTVHRFDPVAVSQLLVEATDAMTIAYHPRPIDGSVLFLAASSTDPSLTVDRWRPLAAELRVEVLEGSHSGDDGIGQPKRVGLTAAAVEAELRRVRGVGH